MAIAGISGAACCAAVILGGCRGREAPRRSGAIPSAAAVDADALGDPGADRARAGHGIGDRVQAVEFAITVEAVKECRKPYVKEGNTLLGVELVVEGLVERDIQVNPFYGQLVDREGLAYRPTFGGCEPRLNNVRLGQGERARGFVNFELPTQAHHLELRYEPATTGGERQMVAVALDR